jgi:hypothetical protein
MQHDLPSCVFGDVGGGCDWVRFLWSLVLDGCDFELFLGSLMLDGLDFEI